MPQYILDDLSSRELLNHEPDCILYEVRAQAKYIVLGVSAKSLQVSISIVMSVRLSAWNDFALTGRIFKKFDIRVFFEDLF
jgi:hypothetical protein